MEEATPKSLELLPVALVGNVHDILQRGITSVDHPDSSNDVSTNKNAKKYLPKNRKFKKEAIASLNRASSLFVLYVTTIAHSIAKANKRSTVVERDVMEALRTCMFWEIERRIVNEQDTQYEEDGDDVEIDDAPTNDLEQMDDIEDIAENPEEMEIDEET
ncbi:hypothetical protein BEWA_005990 [Theileria equi strain WA]|uniref:Transcription factor CBF/NF-Y/archaeal histone domain-containing protein n=1 Tax=Theileria equi strain WA TaxID=1537102 RepID=L0B1R2_THEEQ|nr:hypothetical protein BEWA_005990 [Theileria equi strain WA]AFZ81191.1 hypothetical protein BEWA_005990 [Theileria equi strain WA]|eukprot:XP_004830857.1 hypothetical protein BEWA_005990 [Theileria equi strain WA]